MSIARHAAGHDEPKCCENCNYWYSNNEKVENKSCHNFSPKIDPRHGGQDCRAWEPEED